jgi:hypothetical protein
VGHNTATPSSAILKSVCVLEIVSIIIGTVLNWSVMGRPAPTMDAGDKQ